MSVEPLIKVNGLEVERGGVQVLNLSAFSIAAEEKIAIIGPNGAGKSSLLLALAGLLSHNGQISFKGQEVNKGDLNFRRRIAMVFQEPLLFDTTVLDNVAEGLRIRGIGRTEARDRSMEFLKLFNVEHLAGRSARKLSGGEAQRVSLARALVIRPELILMDEPFSSLDLPSRQALTEDLGRILHESRTAAVIATHDRIEALCLTDRLVVLERGAIIQEGHPSEVVANPVNSFVAAFRKSDFDGVCKGLELK